ncbi:MAG: hypothetical protein AB7T49_17420 [Oligoflexales bacterium]
MKTLAIGLCFLGIFAASCQKSENSSAKNASSDAKVQTEKDSELKIACSNDKGSMSIVSGERDGEYVVDISEGLSVPELGPITQEDSPNPLLVNSVLSAERHSDVISNVGCGSCFVTVTLPKGTLTVQKLGPFEAQLEVVYNDIDENSATHTLSCQKQKF